MPSQSKGGAAGSRRPDTLGELIASYRLRLRQPHSARPWSQEELAFACGTDQAHISRIEKNLKHPQYSTLVRVCEALQLSPSERGHLLSLAGYPIAPSLPGEEEISDVCTVLIPQLKPVPYPILLIDEGERVWYLNDAYNRVWAPCYGFSREKNMLSSLRGKRLAELVFDPDIYARRLPAWKQCFDDVDHLMNRFVGLLWRAYQLHRQDQDMNDCIGRLTLYPQFRRRWDSIETIARDSLLVDHTTFKLEHPRFGSLQLHTWRTRVTLDERFVVIHFTPVDTKTSQILRHSAERED